MSLISGKDLFICNKNLLKLILVLFTMLLLGEVLGQQYTFSGKIIDEATGNPLPFSSVSVNKGKSGTTANQDGEFKIRLEKGNYLINISHIGYEIFEVKLTLDKNINSVFKLNASSTKLDEILIQGEKFYGETVVNNTEMGTVRVKTDQIKLIPTIGGEPDIIKTMQLLPGTIRGVEGGTDFFVRGGDADQNLVLLDGATVYNTGHLLGFMSTFNVDAIGDVKIIKGAFPAYYGGRLSSVLDIKTKREIPEKTEIDASIGLIASKLTINKPILNKKAALKFSVRRTYIDRLLELANNPDIRLPYYFYDFNGSFDYKLDNKNSFYFSAYYAADVLDFSRFRNDDDDADELKSNFDIKGNSQSFGWKHFLQNKKVLDLSLSRAGYLYSIRNTITNDNQNDKVFVTSEIEDYAFRLNYSDFSNASQTINIGLEMISHDISPSVLESEGIIETIFPNNRSNGLFATETAFYANLEKDINSKLRLNLGYRHSFSSADSTYYSGAEPRVALRWKLSEKTSVKASYSRNMQYMHRVSSSNISLPVDIWYTVTKDIKPQRANQWAVGYTHAFTNANVLVEAEVYYKEMQNVTEYEEGSNLLFNTQFEDLLLQGDGRAYGLELLIKKEGEKFNGWISYTLARSTRQFDGLNGGEEFPAKYDRRHNISVVGFYHLSDRVKLSAVWEYISGSRFTAVIGQYPTLNPLNLGVDVFNIYSDRNQIALNDSHRLDLGVVIKNKPGKKFIGEWQFGIYNVYNRATPIALTIEQNESGQFEYQQEGLFGLLPSVSYSFKFR